MTPLRFTHLDRIVWPEEGYTKADLIDYYRDVSRFILPYLKDRPRRGAPVSTPLKWEEADRRVDPGKFTMITMRRRLEKVGDLWEGVLGPGIDMERCLQRLEGYAGSPVTG